jgi:double-strand break repair protein MRE11
MIFLSRAVNESSRHTSVQVDTTGVPTMSNPIRFGQDFVGKIANPRDVLVFHRAKKSAARRVVADEPDRDEEGDEIDKLAAGQVRVHALVQEYLGAQKMQLLGEVGMSDAIQVFVEKDDIHAISKYVSTVRLSRMFLG